MCAQRSAPERFYIQKGGRWLQLDSSGRLQGERRRPRFFYLRRDQLKVSAKASHGNQSPPTLAMPPTTSSPLRPNAKSKGAPPIPSDDSDHNDDQTRRLRPVILLKAGPSENLRRSAKKPSDHSDDSEEQPRQKRAVLSKAGPSQAKEYVQLTSNNIPTDSKRSRQRFPIVSKPSTSRTKENLLRSGNNIPSDDSGDDDVQPRQRPASLSKPGPLRSKEYVQRSANTIPSDDSDFKNERPRSPILSKPNPSRSKRNLQRSAKNIASGDSDISPKRPRRNMSPILSEPKLTRSKENVQPAKNASPKLNKPVSRKLSVSSSSSEDSVIKPTKLPRPSSFRANEIVRIPSKNASKAPNSLTKTNVWDDTGSSSSGEEFVKPTRRSGRLRKSTSVETLDLLTSSPRLKTTRSAAKGGKPSEISTGEGTVTRGSRKRPQGTKKFEETDDTETVAAKRVASLSSWEDGTPTGTSSPRSPRRKPHVRLSRLHFITKSSAAGQRMRIRTESQHLSRASRSGRDASTAGSDKENSAGERDDTSSGGESERDGGGRAANAAAGNAGGRGKGDPSRGPRKQITSIRRPSHFPPPHPRAFSPQEDRAMVHYIQRRGLGNEVNGNTVWRNLQTEWQCICGVRRTWQSLRNRYLRYLLPGLHQLALSPRQARQLRAAAATGTMKLARKRRNSLLADKKGGAVGAWARRPRPALDTTPPHSTSEPKPVVTRSGGRRGLLPLSYL